MKYEPKRNYLYPVLRPYSDDYGDAKLQTYLTQVLSVGKDVLITMDFDVNEESACRMKLKQVRLSAQQCCTVARLCIQRCLKETWASLDCAKRSDARLLVNDVELHPSIVALDNLEPFRRALPTANTVA